MAIINGTEDNDVLTGATASAIADTINGLGGNDDLTAGAGDTLNGDAGNDILRAALSGRTWANGGEGQDTLVVDYSAFHMSVLTDIRANGSGVITNQYGHQTDFTGIERFDITGGAGSDLITSIFQPSRIRSGDGADRVNTGAMAPDADGGAGLDTWIGDFNASTQAITLDMSQTGPINIAGGTIQNFEQLDLTTGSGNDVITGRISPTVRQDNVIRTGAGHDTITVGGNGMNVIDGGLGDDLLTIDYSQMTTVVTNTGTHASRGLVALGTNATVDIQNIERLDIRSGSGADDFTGRDGADILSSGAGNDKVDGRGGDDLIDGGSGADTLTGGLGNDMVTFGSAAAGVTASLLAGGLAGTGDAAGDVYIGIEGLRGSAFADTLQGDGLANTLQGMAGDDTLLGEGGQDSLAGGLGDDTLDGGADADLMIGGAGNDVYFVDNAGDQVVESAGQGADEVRTALQSYQLTDHVETLTGTASTGQALKGNTGDNLIQGGAGDDVLTGGAGADAIRGGAGTDTAVFSGARTGYTAQLLAEGDIRLVGADGTDLVRDVELFQFDDGVFTRKHLLNVKPTLATPLADVSATEDAAFTAQLPADAFADANLDELTYTATLADGSALPAWLTFNAATRTFSGTPANGDVGPLEIKVTATDPFNETASDVFKITVANVNDAPTVNAPIADITTAEDAAFSFQAPLNVFADVDAGDTLTLSATRADGSALPGWLTFNAVTRTFSGTPANEDVGAVEIKLTATDAAGASISDVFTVTVTNTNDAPIVSTPISDLATAEDALFSFQAPANVFADVDLGDALTLTAARGDGSALPSWLCFDAATRTFSGTPANGDVGAVEIRLTATDASGAAVSEVFTVTVTNTNDAPVVSAPIADIVVAEDAAFSFQAPALTFADVDAGDVLSFSATRADGSALPSWLTFNAATRTFSGTPANGDVGAIDIRLTATDASGASASDVFKLTVSNTNDAPTVVAPIADMTTAEDAPFSFQAPSSVFADVDAGDTLTLSATRADGSALPSWLSFNAATRTFSGTPLDGDVGVLDIKLIATDASGASVSDVFRLTVTDVDNDGGPVSPPMNVINGTSRSDMLTGTSGADAISGFDGADILRGKNGDDLLDGGDGTDLLFGDSGADVLKGGLGADVLDGGQGDDVLMGGEGSDALNGGTGNDRLLGGAGADVLVGGSGDDVFVFERGGGSDLVMDFRTGPSGGDVIDLRAFTDINSFAELSGMISRNALGHVVIDMGGGDSMTLFGVKAAELSADDFLFSPETALAEPVGLLV